MAKEPTEKKVSARKKKSESDATTEIEKPKRARATKAVPVPMFQAAPVSTKPSTASASKSSPEDKPSRKRVVKAPTGKESEPLVDGDEGSRRRRRRRGGKGRHKDGDEQSLGSSQESANASGDTGEVTLRKRRKRVRPGQEPANPGEVVDEDGVVTVVKVRETRAPKTREKRDDFRRERKFNRRERGSREFNRDSNFRENYREGYREPYRENRRRGVILTEGEFLSRRESVEREMLVRQKGDRTQIAVIEDQILVEHYVNRNSAISYVGNVYLGKVQNVLPSMEAAFVDIGKGRNAVLYAGEVNWDEAGLAENQEKKIEHVLKTGQMVMVQVTKDPIGQKGARLTSQVSLPGRFVVFVPSGEMSGISRKLPDTERARLKEILSKLITEEEGVIVRTAAEGASEEELTRDVARLKAQWEDIKKKSENKSINSPTLLYGEPDLTVRVIRDIFNEDFKKLIVEGDGAWEDINNYLGHVAPELTAKLEKYSGRDDLFTAYKIDEQLSKALDRKVYLPSGGSLVIDRTEAMVVIDVNTGKFIGKGGNLEETVTKNNLEAAEEIARQLRLRDLGGIVVIDFIDMILESNREQVLRRLVECLGRDRTKHQVAEVTSLGLVQMTRKRVGQGLIEAFSTTCDSCGGRGIHIHTDPVNKRSLEKDSDESKSELVEVEAAESKKPAADLGDGAPFAMEAKASEPTEKRSLGRRRRRAVSTGVITAE
jgi:ribonuclease E